MAYNQQNRSSNGYRQGGNNYSKPQGQAGAPAKSDAILSKLMRATKTGKSISFSTQDKPVTIPANCRVVVTPLSQKRQDALAKSSADKGFKGSVPTHELVVFPISETK